MEIKQVIKRYFDILLSFLGLAVSSPLWLIIGMVIMLDDGWPIFYSQERVGKDGTVFKIIKFRTMIKNAEKDTGAVWAETLDPRVTKSGKILRATAMDELPQLLSIIKGDMSFVGPRPERPELVAKFIKDFPEFSLRHNVKPGLTGVAQVLGSAYLDYREKFKYDIWYIRNQGFSLDVYLVIMSFLVTFAGKWEVNYEKTGIISVDFKNEVDREIAEIFS